MADETNAAPAVAQKAEAAAPAENVTPALPSEPGDKKEEAAASEAPARDNSEVKEAAKSEEPFAKADATDSSAPAEKEARNKEAAKPAEEPTKEDESNKQADTEMKDGGEPEAATADAGAAPAENETKEQMEKSSADAAEGAADATSAAPTTPAAGAKSTPAKSATKDRRKSTGAAQSGKKLNKKASKARITHLDAKPGDHYFVKLKGHPKWPVIICDDDMLPQSLLNSRPVTAKRADGTYRDDFADGGKKAADRTYPVMYLYTNEFGWVPNTDLSELDPETVLEEKTDKMRKDLKAAYELASEHHDLSFYKDLLAEFQQDLLDKQRQKEAKAATPAKKKKAKAEVDGDGDVDMDDEDEAEAEPEPEVKKSSKKRKAEENAETPARTDSVKKPKIKLHTNSTPKAANGATSTPKSAKTGETKSAKSKKKSKDQEKKQEKEVTPKEPELSPEEKHARKEKEVLFLRHKLQKGLLTRDSEPKEEDMKLMSDYITKLEGFPDLEVSIIRATKINKVLKALLKLEHIPKEDEFKFKPRSQVLLDKWNKLLASDGTPAAESANGVNGTAEGKSEKKEKTNGVKAQSESVEPKPEEKAKPEKAAEEKPDGAEKSETVEANA